MLPADQWGLVGAGIVNTGIIFALVRLWIRHTRLEQQVSDLERHLDK